MSIIIIVVNIINITYYQCF